MPKFGFFSPKAAAASGKYLACVTDTGTIVNVTQIITTNSLVDALVKVDEYEPGEATYVGEIAKVLTEEEYRGPEKRYGSYSAKAVAAGWPIMVYRDTKDEMVYVTDVILAHSPEEAKQQVKEAKFADTRFVGELVEFVRVNDRRQSGFGYDTGYGHRDSSITSGMRSNIATGTIPDSLMRGEAKVRTFKSMGMKTDERQTQKYGFYSARAISRGAIAKRYLDANDKEVKATTVLYDTAPEWAIKQMQAIDPDAQFVGEVFQFLGDDNGASLSSSNDDADSLRVGSMFRQLKKQFPATKYPTELKHERDAYGTMYGFYSPFNAKVIDRASVYLDSTGKEVLVTTVVMAPSPEEAKAKEQDGIFLGPLKQFLYKIEVSTKTKIPENDYGFYDSRVAQSRGTLIYIDVYGNPVHVTNVFAGKSAEEAIAEMKRDPTLQATFIGQVVQMIPSGNIHYDNGVRSNSISLSQRM